MAEATVLERNEKKGDLESSLLFEDGKKCINAVLKTLPYFIDKEEGIIFYSESGRFTQEEFAEMLFYAAKKLVDSSEPELFKHKKISGEFADYKDYINEKIQDLVRDGLISIRETDICKLKRIGHAVQKEIRVFSGNNASVLNLEKIVRKKNEDETYKDYESFINSKVELFKYTSYILFEYLRKCPSGRYDRAITEEERKALSIMI